MALHLLQDFSRLDVPEQIDLFLARANSGPFAYKDCHHFSGNGTHQRHTVLGFITHGNEHGSLPAALALQAALMRTTPAGPVTLLLGNIEAAREDKRFLDEDYNRVFTFDRPATSKERKRAERVRPVLESADFFLDFHQTQTPTASPFYTFPWDTALGCWSQLLAAAPVGLTRSPGKLFSPGLRCLDEYVRAQGRTGLTVEVGYRGQAPQQAALVETTAKRLLRAVDETALGHVSIEDLAKDQPPIKWYTTTHIVETNSPKMRLKAGLSNWSKVMAGEALHAEGSPAFHSPSAGRALFPKYPAPGQPAPPELLRIATEIEDPQDLARPTER